MLIGHQKQWQFLKKSTELGKTSHAYLFIGQEKLGKKTVALEWISLLFGHPPTKLLKGGHPDFILIAPVQKDSNPPSTLSSFARASIQIGQIRDLNWKLSLKPFSGPLKVAIIDQAHSMNQEAQNCFLKTLEEPRGETLLILITEHPEFLFPTIRSRAEIIKFYPVPKKEIENYLKEQGVEEKKAKFLSQISAGRPGVAIDFLTQPQKLKEREDLINELTKLIGADLTSRFQYAQKISQSPQLKEILNLWLSCFREILLSKIKENQKLSVSDINRLKEIQKTNFLISTTNVNPRLALETLFLELSMQGGTLHG